MLAASDPPPMKYKSIVKKKDFSKINLEGVTHIGFNVSSMKRKYPCPIFDGTRGIKAALIYVEETFKKLAMKLKYDSQEGFDYWELCLSEGALDHWENINDTTDSMDKTSAKFNELILKFYLRCSSTEAIYDMGCSEPRRPKVLHL